MALFSSSGHKSSQTRAAENNTHRWPRRALSSTDVMIGNNITDAYSRAANRAITVPVLYFSAVMCYVLVDVITPCYDDVFRYRLLRH